MIHTQPGEQATVWRAMKTHHDAMHHARSRVPTCQCRCAPEGTRDYAYAPGTGLKADHALRVR